MEELTPTPLIEEDAENVVDHGEGFRGTGLVPEELVKLLIFPVLAPLLDAFLNLFEVDERLHSGVLDGFVAESQVIFCL